MTMDFSNFDDDAQEMVDFLTREQFEMVAEKETNRMEMVEIETVPATPKTNRVGIRKLSRAEIMASFNFA